jgi:hypothetical protein
MKRLAVIAVFLSAGLACGGGDDEPTPAAQSTSSSTSTTAAPAPDRCAAFREIARQDDRFQGELNAMMEPVMAAAQRGDKAAAEAAADEMTRKMQVLLDAGLPPLLTAYDGLAKAAPELEPDVRLVRDFTVKLAEKLSKVDGVDEFQRAVKAAAEQGGLQAGAATLRLDKVSRAECDVVIAD